MLNSQNIFLQLRPFLMARAQLSHKLKFSGETVLEIGSNFSH